VGEVHTADGVVAGSPRALLTPHRRLSVTRPSPVVRPSTTGTSTSHATRGAVSSCVEFAPPVLMVGGVSAQRGRPAHDNRDVPSRCERWRCTISRGVSIVRNAAIPRRPFNIMPSLAAAKRRQSIIRWKGGGVRAILRWCAVCSEAPALRHRRKQVALRGRHMRHRRHTG